MGSTFALPEPGQLVAVRHRRYVVVDVVQNTLPPDILAKNSLTARQHLVTLSSVEDDALGEELQVIWEIEPGAQHFDGAALPEPTGFDAPERLDTFLNAVRWGAASSADVQAIQAPFRSSIQLEDYQLDPVARAIEMPRVNLLIADDVGLGKTIEAGLVIQELIIRHRARRVLIDCPASLQVQWRDQTRDKFGLEFRIVDSKLVSELRRERGPHVNPWSHFPRLITSVDYLKRERPLRLFGETLPREGESLYPRKYDLLIVDEAHNVAPSGRGKYATDSQKTQALRRIAPHFEHKLFLSATPHNGYRESFSALLELLDNQRFVRGVNPNQKQLETIMVRRLKSEMKDWDGSSRFPERKIADIRISYTQQKREIHRALREYSRRHEKQAREQGDNTSLYAVDFVTTLLKKRLFSSPMAFLSTLEKHIESLTAPRRHAAVTRRPSVGILRSKLEQIEQEHDDEEELYDATAEALEATAPLFEAPPISNTPYEKYSTEEIWQHIEHKREGASSDHAQIKDLKLPEWRMLIDPDNAPSDDDFKVSSADLPIEYEYAIQQVVLVERLREVRALTGVTRLESLSDYKEDEKLPRDHIMPLARKKPTWVAATEVRGEGIFIQFREEALQRWLEQSQVQAHAANFFNAHKRWRNARHIPEPEANYPGLRYVLMHTFAHALMRQLTLESGYPTASIRERIYAQEPEKEGGTMAGILLYTSASDSEGTLGGLVSLGKDLESNIYSALEEMKRCTSDPLCAEHTHLNDNTLHGAACHACMFAPETFCERGNRYLDRSVLVPTVENSSLVFFQ